MARAVCLTLWTESEWAEGSCGTDDIYQGQRDSVDVHVEKVTCSETAAEPCSLLWWLLHLSVQDSVVLKRQSSRAVNGGDAEHAAPAPSGGG